MKLSIVTLLVATLLSLAEVQAQTIEKTPDQTEHKDDHDKNHRHRRFRLFLRRHTHHHNENHDHAGDRGQKLDGGTRSHRH